MLFTRGHSCFKGHNVVLTLGKPIDATYLQVGVVANIRPMKLSLLQHTNSTVTSYTTSGHERCYLTFVKDYSM